jgi:maltooligosyltrehalose trehalohydrolase
VRSKIDLNERHEGFHRQMFDLHKDLLRLRREEPAFRRVQRRGDIDGAVLGPDAFVLRFFARPGETSGTETVSAGDRLLIVNFGVDGDLNPAPEPLLAPPVGHRWSILWTSEDPRYGGSGTAALDTEMEGWHIPGRTAVVLAARPAREAEVQTRFRVEGSAQAARRREEAALQAESINH